MLLKNITMRIVRALWFRYFIDVKYILISLTTLRQSFDFVRSLNGFDDQKRLRERTRLHGFSILNTWIIFSIVFYRRVKKKKNKTLVDRNTFPSISSIKRVESLYRLLVGGKNKRNEN